MKRILGLVVSLLVVLAFCSLSRATLVTYDLSSGVFNPGMDTVSSYAPNPPGFFVTPFDAGSNVVLDYEGSSVSLVSGTLNINATMLLGLNGSIITNVQMTMSGGTGTFIPYAIFWSTPTSFTSTGTFQCMGGFCTLAGLTQGTAYPIAMLPSIMGTTPVNPVNLGTWSLLAGVPSAVPYIVNSTPAVVQLGGASPPPGQGLPAQWFMFGSVPEPSTIAVVLLGLGVLALRRARG